MDKLILKTTPLINIISNDSVAELVRMSNGDQKET